VFPRRLAADAGSKVALAPGGAALCHGHGLFGFCLVGIVPVVLKKVWIAQPHEVVRRRREIAEPQARPYHRQAGHEWIAAHEKEILFVGKQSRIAIDGANEFLTRHVRLPS
jgi:hypothetical protein